MVLFFLHTTSIALWMLKRLCLAHLLFVLGLTSLLVLKSAKYLPFFGESSGEFQWYLFVYVCILKNNFGFVTLV